MVTTSEHLATSPAPISPHAAEAPRPGRGSGSLLAGTLRRQWRPVLALLGWSVLEGVPGFLSGRLLGLAVDNGFAGGNVAAGLLWIAAFGLLAVIGAFGSRRVLVGLGAVVEPLRDDLVDTVVRGVLRRGAGVRRLPEGAVVARLTRHVEVIRDVTAGLLVQARSFAVTAVAALAGLLSVAAALTWVVLPPVVVALVLFGLLLPALVRRQRTAVLCEERAAEEAGAVLDGVRDVVACGAQRPAARGVGVETDAQAAATVRLAHASALRTVVVAIGGYLPLGLVLAAAPGLVAGGVLGTGTVIAAVTYLTTGVQPALRGLTQVIGSAAVRLTVTLRRLREVTAPPPDNSLNCLGGPAPADATVSVRGLSFRWGPRARPIVGDLDLDIPDGTHVALVGPSGTGKSTLVGLLTGTLAPQAGQIRLGGVPLGAASAAELRRAVALIPQETYVFGGTVRENLALLAPEVSDDALLRAAWAVGADAIVAQLGGLDATLGHGGEPLSAGERQLLALARVHAGPARLVILDEATSALDPAAEARAEEAFRQRGGTLLVVAHRLSSAFRADRVLLLDGRDVVYGTHDDLVRRSPRYADLVRAWRR
ncbi:ABC transporter ATP-binding protein [Longimycelium tulufanense]|uniref:ABC transporter ATP-binding protein n=1 Tax=Longimycelium tulufanense TaxID=907463 RepID=A0A8J3CEI1_9PSEU|nr:ABC transporter ATP-binding protein [Longimycelium tulufanense]GGM63136.1 ABC transporter ATP-binding protein [Longimycelium tulufanense]